MIQMYGNHLEPKVPMLSSVNPTSTVWDKVKMKSINSPTPLTQKELLPLKPKLKLKPKQMLQKSNKLQLKIFQKKD